jgi:uncharacterized protein (DUF433 family)
VETTPIMNISWQNYIEINPDIRFGKPIIIGTRICVSDILSWLASGMSHETILIDFPELKNEHILAALSFAANRENITKIIAA